ncbi:MAG: hypothetical protein FWG43_05155, partial [Clostridiales bacterium]|nr:hypothetical protein [Clostridiales bacterium]
VKGMQKAGIWHAQFNINDAEMLKDAQLHPEKYPDLMMRVAGYSAFFCALTPEIQNDIIDRTVYSI